jgi:hypothetical protein
MSLKKIQKTSIWKPTMQLRWLYNENSTMKVLQQRWVSTDGEDRWENIESVNEK